MKMAMKMTMMMMMVMMMMMMMMMVMMLMMMTIMTNNQGNPSTTQYGHRMEQHHNKTQQNMSFVRLHYVATFRSVSRCF